MSRVRIAVAGASGRMGRMLIEATLKDVDAELVAAIDIPGSPALGKTAGELVGLPCSVTVTADEVNVDRISYLIRSQSPAYDVDTVIEIYGPFPTSFFLHTVGYASGAGDALAVALGRRGGRDRRPPGGAERGAG